MKEKCKFVKYERNWKTINILNFSCDEVRALKDKWLEDYRIRNYTDYLIAGGGIDLAYEGYKQEIEDFLDRCECEKE